MTIQTEHEAAFRRMASRRELMPGAENHIIDAQSGTVSRATVWLHGDIWFFDHYDQSSPVYEREYLYAARHPRTFWRPRAYGPTATEE